MKVGYPNSLPSAEEHPASTTAPGESVRRGPRDLVPACQGARLCGGLARLDKGTTLGTPADPSYCDSHPLPTNTKRTSHPPLKRQCPPKVGESEKNRNAFRTSGTLCDLFKVLPMIMRRAGTPRSFVGN
jgi:hypothetical protein